MSYSAGEALVLTVVQKATSYDAANTARNDWRLLNTGKSATYAILRPGRTAGGFAGVSLYSARRTTVIEIWERCGANINATVASVMDRADEVMAQLNKYPHLGSEAVVTDSNVTAVEAPLEMWKKGATAPAWVRVDITLEWIEQTVVSFSE